MLSIENISIIAEKVIVISGHCSNLDTLSAASFLFTCGHTTQPGESIHRYKTDDIPAAKQTDNESIIGFTVTLALECSLVTHPLAGSIQVNGIDHSFDVIDEYSLRGYLEYLYSDEENFRTLNSELTSCLLDMVNDPGAEILQYQNLHEQDFAILRINNDEGESTALFIHATAPSQRYTIDVPAGKNSHKQIIEVKKNAVTTVIKYTTKKTKSDFNLQFISSLKAYTLIIKKLSRSNRGDKNFDLSRIGKNLIRSCTSSGRGLLVEQYNKAQVFQKDGNYEDFLSRFEPKIKAFLSGHYQKLTDHSKPKISIITPLDNKPLSFFEELYASFTNQEHQNWEWVLIHDHSTDSSRIQVVEDLIRNDPRIKMTQTEADQHISATTNSGINLATGDLIGFCDHDSLLNSHAFIAIALAYHKHPEAQWFYSDEDYVTDDGVRHEPHLKSAFNPERLKNHNYIKHLSLVKKQAFEQLEQLPSLCSSDQHYDLHLKLASNLSASEIVHIPLVLHHSRKAVVSTVKNPASKSSHLQPTSQSHSKIDHSDSQVLVSIIIPFRDYTDLLKNCLNSIERTCNSESFELILVNNNSTDPSMLALLSELEDQAGVTIINDNEDFNFSRLINRGADAARGECLLLLNNDVEAIHEGWLEELRTLAMNESTGCVGCKLVYSDFTIQHAGMALGPGGYVSHSHRGKDRDFSDGHSVLEGRFNISSVTAAVLAVRKNVFDQVGGFDENYRVEYNDVDFNLKVFKAGYWNICTSYAELIHFESKTRGKNITPAKKAKLDKEKKRFTKSWAEYIEEDPFFHPFLTKMRDDHSFAESHEWKIDYSVITGRTLEIKKHSLRN